MRTLNVTISDKDYKQYNIKEDQLSFSRLIDIINKKMARETLRECVDLAQKNGLSEMTLDEINKEIQAVRKNAKARHPHLQ